MLTILDREQQLLPGGTACGQHPASALPHSRPGFNRVTSTNDLQDIWPAVIRSFRSLIDPARHEMRACGFIATAYGEQ